MTDSIRPPSLECRKVTRALRSGEALLTVLDAVDLRIEPSSSRLSVSASSAI